MKENKPILPIEAIAFTAVAIVALLHMAWLSNNFGVEVILSLGYMDHVNQYGSPQQIVTNWIFLVLQVAGFLAAVFVVLRGKGKQ